MTIENILRQAQCLGLSGLCLTDHLHPKTSLEQFSRLRAELDCSPIPSDLRVWVGCEAEVLAPGRFTLAPSAASHFDLVLVAPYHGLDWVDRPRGHRESEIAEFILLMMHSALDCPGVRVVAHPVLVWMEWAFDLERVYRIMLESRSMSLLLKRAARGGIAMEINSKFTSGPLREMVLPFYRRCLEQGVKLSLGSDAHSPEGMDIWDEFQTFVDDLGAEVPGCLWIPSEHLPAAHP